MCLRDDTAGEQAASEAACVGEEGDSLHMDGHLVVSLSLVLVALEDFQGVLSQYLLPPHEGRILNPSHSPSVSTPYEEDSQEHRGWEGGLLKGNTVESGVFWSFLDSLWREERRAPSLGFLMAPLWPC